MPPRTRYSGGGSNTRRVEQETLVDFTGALNLKANPFQVLPNQLPDILDMDVDPSGGAKRRKCVTESVALSGQFDGLWVYNSASGGQVRMAAQRSGSDTLIKNLETLATLHTIPAGRVRGITFNDVCYMVSEAAVPFRYNGTTLSTLGEVWTEVPPTPETPIAGGYMPRGKVIAVWNDVVWVANTSEADGEHPNRLRYSWPGHAEYWSETNLFELDSGEDHDEIVALVPHGDRLIVFKRRSMYAIHGYDPDTFERQRLSSVVGAVSSEAVAASDWGLFFVDWPHGVYEIPYNGDPKLVSDKLTPIFQDGRIPPASRAEIYCSWVGSRLYVGVPWRDAAQGRTFVYDPSLGEGGGWTQYSIGVHQVAPMFPSNAANYYLGIATHSSAPTTQRIVQLEAAGDQDLGAHRIPALFQIRWFDAGDPLIGKRFRKCGFVFSGTPLQVAAYLDYTMTSAKKHFTLTSASPSGSTKWGEAKWGEFVWTSAPDRDDLEVKEGSSIGSGRALSLVISCPSTSDWAVTAVTIKYLLKRRRG